ncbi:tetratricopeptide repeat-containing sensor histidine kinase [Winogradskyella luteola]|uniref:histidine kinase n=1 Tax=Winogradskyella luteola TaxID=2828330 RepID=A0A9X1FAX5_9FLAO|nr:tetratricopeptide repeat protein [Winogradskyella luteola]MBV7269628.1 sensor histidine kinase [Winogradskyella luteola]
MIDSIFSLISYSENKDFSSSKQLNFLNKANSLAKELQNDSILLLAQKKIRNYYFNNEDFSGYIESNQKIKLLAKRLNDSSSLAHAYNALGYAYFLNDRKDSSYYYYSKAVKAFDKINADVNLSYALGSLSKLQLDGKDYFGAGESAVKALRLLNGVEETNDIQDQKWILYNTLASISEALDDDQQSLEYYNEAYEVAQRMENDFNNSIYTLNNIAFVKRKQGKYAEAIKIFENILDSNTLYQKDPSFYALILENLAYTNFLTGSYQKKEIIDTFERSYQIADSIDDDITKMGTAISMAKFYMGIDEKQNALSKVKDAYNLAKNIESNEILLESLLLLSKLNEGEESVKYLNEHIKITDSLLKVERGVRNKHARIELQTDQLEAENEQISKENLYLAILSIGLLLTAILTYVVISQRAKNRKLKLIQVRQKANEDIYNLMLGQQDKVDEARTQEKKRISEELHDGVLGRLFGTRLSLDSINFKDGKEAMMTRANYIGQLKTIEEDIRKISHELNTDFVSGTGFMDIVSELIENQTQAYGLKYDFDYTDDISWDIVPNKTKINIYRIIQESMQNIYKHANAKAIKISISLEKSVICLDIIDDGEGFDTSKSKKGIGLKNMTSRVEDINGKIIFTSQSGNGTKVNVKIPYTNQST